MKSPSAHNGRAVSDTSFPALALQPREKEREEKRERRILCCAEGLAFAAIEVRSPAEDPSFSLSFSDECAEVEWESRDWVRFFLDGKSLGLFSPPFA